MRVHKKASQTPYQSCGGFKLPPIYFPFLSKTPFQFFGNFNGTCCSASAQAHPTKNSNTINAFILNLKILKRTTIRRFSFKKSSAQLQSIFLPKRSVYQGNQIFRKIQTDDYYENFDRFYTIPK